MQQRVHWGFQYTGGADPSRYSRSKITKDDLKDQVLGLLKNVAGMANIAGTFSAGRRPWEVLSSSRVDPVCFVQINPENYQSRPPLPEDVPLTHTDSSVPLTSFVLYFGSDSGKTRKRSAASAGSIDR